MQTKKKWLICILLVAMAKITSAQVGSSDSLFLANITSSNLYVDASIYPGNWYVYDALDSLADLYTSLDSIFKFNANEFNGSYDSIEITSGAYFDSIRNNSFNENYFEYGTAYFQTNPLQQINFTLKSKQATSFFTQTPTSSQTNKSDIAFFIIPGSGDNQTTAIIRGSGYHNTNCAIKNELKQYGDVYIHCKPLEDYRALRWLERKIDIADYVTPGYPSYIYTYLNSLGKPYGINYLIESIATIKYLKSKYKKVVVLGCSQGGYATLLASLEAQADGYVISSGYSIHLNNSTADAHAISQIFDYLINNKMVKAHLQMDSAYYKFTWANYDSPIYQDEHDNHHTENYFNKQDNVSYYYNYNHHSFPPCLVIDSFVQKVLSKPMSKLTVMDFACSNNSVTLEAKFSGSPPYSFDLFCNDSLAMQLKSVSDSMVLHVRTAGVYQIKNLLDATTNLGNNSDSAFVGQHTYLNMTLDSKTYNCDSNKFNYHFELVGDQPYEISYTENGQLKSINNISTNNIDLFLGNGLAVINSIKNNNGCIKLLNDSLLVDTQLDATSLFDSLQFVCDANFTRCKIKEEFTNLSKIIYNRNGILDSSNVLQNGFDLHKGDYLFTQLVFNTGCIKNINVPFSTDTVPTIELNYEGLKLYVPEDNGSFYKWFLNDKAIESATGTFIKYQGNGTYFVEVTMPNGCVYKSNSRFVNEDDVLVFPNPVVDNFTFICNLPLQSERAPSYIFDASGNMVKEFSVVQGINTYSIADLAPGVYYFLIRPKLQLRDAIIVKILKIQR